MTKTVKYYSSQDTGAPQLLQTGWGHMVNLYRTLCNGYNEQIAESISYNSATKLIKINFPSNIVHGYRIYQTVHVSISGNQYDNSEFFIVNVADNYIQCQRKNKIDYTEVLATGTIKVKVAALGLIHAYTDTVGKSAFKFPPENGEDPTYLVINDTQPTEFAWNNATMCATPAVYMCKNLSDIDGFGENIVPFNYTYTNAYKGGAWKDTELKNYWNYGIMNILYQGNWTSSSSVNNTAIINTPVKWTLIGNQDYHLLYIYPNMNSTYSAGPILYTFGKYISSIHDDEYNYIFNAAYNYIQNRTTSSYYADFHRSFGSISTEWNNILACGSNNIFASYRLTTNKNLRGIIPGSAINEYAQTEFIGLKGIITNMDVDLFIRPTKFNASTWSGVNGERWPSFDGKVKISRMYIYESISYIERGKLKGVYWIHHNNPFIDKSVIKITDENDRSFYALCMKNAGNSQGHNFTYVNSNESDTYSYILISLDEVDWDE